MPDLVTADTRHNTASVVVIDIERALVLLVHHLVTDRWMFPGGHVDANQAPDEAALREVLEETGVQATIAAQRPHNLPGMQWRPSPWITAEIPAPAKPERPGKPAEPPHSHIDFLFIGTADSTAPLAAQLDEVAAALWVPIGRRIDLNVRAEVPNLAVAAFGELHLSALTGGSR